MVLIVVLLGLLVFVSLLWFGVIDLIDWYYTRLLWGFVLWRCVCWFVVSVSFCFGNLLEGVFDCLVFVGGWLCYIWCCIRWVCFGCCACCGWTCVVCVISSGICLFCFMLVVRFDSSLWYWAITLVLDFVLLVYCYTGCFGFILMFGV